MMTKNKINYSIIIPILNEGEIINELYERLTMVMKKIAENYEIIFVDDGSRDKSFEILELLHQKDGKIKVIKFSRNFGHHVAITAGLDYAQGDAVVLMDGDLQDPPEEILKLNERFKEGYDIVYAIRKTRKDPIIKGVLSKMFYKIFNLIGKVEIPPKTGIFRMMSKRTVNYLNQCRERSRFVIGLISWIGFSAIGVETNRDERRAGRPKYNLFKSMKLAIDAIISFSTSPLHLASISGLMIAILSFLTGFYMLIRKIIFGMPVSSYASIIVSIFFLGGVQLIIIGVIGEYIGKIYREVQNRPLYIIEKHLK